MAGEAGETCNEVKKLRRLDDNPYNDAALERSKQKEKIAKELADTIIYADLLAARLGIDLGDAVIQKFNEVSRRVHSKIYLDHQDSTPL
jgi:NTP pyrophosphatase (non-canonical NTP hydrolase)